MIVPREMLPSDRAFVVSTWARSQRGARERVAFAIVNRLLDIGATRVVVLGTSGTAIHGWAACTRERDALHYAYVPPELRGNGLARLAITELLGSYPDRIMCSHKWPRSSRRFVWNPAILHLALIEAAA